MAREEADREDLMHEATALVQRVELSAGGQPVIIGFRTSGAVSVFFDADPVYQFNSNREVRRAFVAGELYKVEDGTLISLHRERGSDAVVLLRREPDSNEVATFRETLHLRIRGLREGIANSEIKFVAQIPFDEPVFQRVTNWLDGLKEPIPFAKSPHAK